ncbi:hypothetical protein KEJ43_05610 [Candidatus Bathyarchaeota archaeon]|nr:hypothetical protein [Candidatus Bathyarchaeota archaeon]
MTHAYTPGLQIKESVIVRKVRRLPIKGEVIVNIGDIVDYNDIIAKSKIPGDPYTVKASYMLKCEPDEVPRYMIKKVGDAVKKDEIIAKFTGFFGLIKNIVTSPVDGYIESLSTASGQIIIRETPKDIAVDAYIPGKVIRILHNEGAIIETNAAFIQGIFGVGGENHGEIVVAVDSPKDILTEEHIIRNYKGKIVVGGALVTGEALKKAIEIGVKGIVTGGIRNSDLRSLLGYDIGVAITGYEDIGLTLIITEGFGKMDMSYRTFNLLKKFEGELAHVNGETHIRAGVIRPEIIIPHSRITANYNEQEKLEAGMKPGTTVRVIRSPYFGKLAKVVSLPPELRKSKTESYVRVVEIELDNNQRVIVPRANVEIIEE